MASSRICWWVGMTLPVLALLLIILSDPVKCENQEYFSQQEHPTRISEKTLRHIMQLVSLGTGLKIPPPFNLRYREKSLKRARLTAPYPRRHDLGIGSEFLGKRSIQDDPVDSEFSGSVPSGNRLGSEFSGSVPSGNRLGSEFSGSVPTGNRLGSEFTGSVPSGNRLGSEFPGSDLVGQRVSSEFPGKRFGSEFLGKRMGSEFLGKRVGSEFLGKRLGSEFLGKRLEEDDPDENNPYKRLGSEFLGKRHGGDLSLEPESKRMGSEFLGRRKRGLRTSSEA